MHACFVQSKFLTFIVTSLLYRGWHENYYICLSWVLRNHGKKKIEEIRTDAWEVACLQVWSLYVCLLGDKQFKTGITLPLGIINSSL